IMVGSRSMLDEVVQLFDRKQLRPIVDRVFAFDEAPAAYAHLQSGQHFGKIVIRVAQ
ncbi:zinc-binding dehydrogenase, partial [Burkholderia multivorans]|nr:zinc-binding dehydrogenase [Burkholderia multivorans]